METAATVSRRTVAEAMLTNPKTHGLDVTVSEAADLFADDHVHMLLLTRGAELHGTLLRADLRPDLHPRRPAIEVATLSCRTTGPDQHVDEALQLMYRGHTRRLAVTDGDHRLLGLLCLKRTLHGFCDESDVLARKCGKWTASP